jgi:hypothetical protein
MSSCLRDRHGRSIKTLSIRRPRPSMELLIPAPANAPVKAAPVTWLPSVLKISGLPYRAGASPGESLTSKQDPLPKGLHAYIDEVVDHFCGVVNQ